MSVHDSQYSLLGNQRGLPFPFSTNGKIGGIQLSMNSLKHLFTLMQNIGNNHWTLWESGYPCMYSPSTCEMLDLVVLESQLSHMTQVSSPFGSNKIRFADVSACSWLPNALSQGLGFSSIAKLGFIMPSYSKCFLSS